MTYQEALDAWRRLEGSGHSGRAMAAKDGCTDTYTLFVRVKSFGVFCGSEDAVRQVIKARVAA